MLKKPCLLFTFSSKAAIMEGDQTDKDTAMRCVTQTLEIAKRIGTERALRLLAECGFDGADLTMTDVSGEAFSDPTFSERIRLVSGELGLPITQAHAPFPGKRYGDEEYSRLYDGYVRTAIRTAAQVGAGCIVVHPIHCPTLSAAEQMEWNLEYYRQLGVLARQEGVRIALENMYGYRDGHHYPNVCSLSEELAAYADALDDPLFTVCADLGHFPLVGEDTPHAIRCLAGRLGALHVHDNDWRNDTHTVPYLGKNPWDEITSALAEVDYRGDLTFETDKGYLPHLPEELFASALRHLCQVGRHLISEIERKRP